MVGNPNAWWGTEPIHGAMTVTKAPPLPVLHHIAFDGVEHVRKDLADATGIYTGFG